jgi:plastocyanin
MPAQNDIRPDRGFTQLAAVFALLLSMAALLAVAFKTDNSGSQIATAASPTAAPAQHVKIVIKSDEEHGKLGPEGTWHDAFLPADFSVKAGATVKVTVYNYDEGEHSFTSSQLGTNVMIAAGTESKPAVTTFTFHAPQKAGNYLWICAMPCDPWAMNHDGFMRGYVKVI